RTEMVEDRHTLGKDSAVRRHQGRSLAHRVDAQIALAFHCFRHLDPAEPIRLAQPFERDDRAERASRGHTVEKNGFHCLVSVADEVVNETGNVPLWTLVL